MKYSVVILLLLLTACAGAPPVGPAPPSQPGAQLYTATNGTVTVTASSNYGAAVVSIVDAAGHQYVNTTDHGREFQTAYQLDGLNEGENPTEAGARADVVTSTTVILDAGAAGNVLHSRVHPAYWDPYNGATVSPDLMEKTVTVGWNALTNVVRWDVTMTVMSDHSLGQFEGLTGYGPTLPDLYLMQPDGSFTPTPQPTGYWVYYSQPVVESSPDGAQAIGVYSPDNRPGQAYWNALNVSNAGVNKWDCVWWKQAPLSAGSYAHVCYVAVGTLTDVEASLRALVSSP